MSRFIFIGNQIINTQKAKSLFELSKQKLNIPLTVMLTDIGRINEVKSYFQPSASVFCRINYSDTAYPHYESKICLVNDIERQIKIMLNKLNDYKIDYYDIIVQEMLNLSWSGAVLSKNEISLVEFVYGNTAHLLRDGIFYKRFFIDRKLNILKQEKGMQSQFKDLVDNQLILKDIPNLSFNIGLLLENISHLTAENTLYEFGLNDNQFFFLESKKIQKKAYPRLCLLEYDKIPFIIWKDDRFSLNKMEVVQLPIFDNIACVDINKTYKISNGTYLSHFAIYLANNSINSYFD
ncbi:MAG: hypothetical protein E6767_16855 [Dysgonomonas sp.]|nr:hypothetical protein [Dysgonomonas sp.]